MRSRSSSRSARIERKSRCDDERWSRACGARATGGPPVALEAAVCPGADRDRDWHRAGLSRSAARSGDEAAQRRLHHPHSRGRAADHLRHRRGRHRQDGRHEAGRDRRVARDHLFRGGLNAGAVCRSGRRQSAGARRGPSYRPGLAGREGGRDLRHRREIADDRRFPDEDDPAKHDRRGRPGRHHADPRHRGAVRRSCSSSLVSG